MFAMHTDKVAYGKQLGTGGVGNRFRYCAQKRCGAKLLAQQRGKPLTRDAITNHDHIVVRFTHCNQKGVEPSYWHNNEGSPSPEMPSPIMTTLL